MNIWNSTCSKDLIASGNLWSYNKQILLEQNSFLWCKCCKSHLGKFGRSKGLTLKWCVNALKTDIRGDETDIKDDGDVGFSGHKRWEAKQWRSFQLLLSRVLKEGLIWSMFKSFEDATSKAQGYNSASRNLWGIQIAHLSCLRGVWFRSLTSLKDSVKNSRCPLKCRFSVGSQPYQQPMRLSSRWGELPAASQRTSGVGPIWRPRGRCGEGQHYSFGLLP